MRLGTNGAKADLIQKKHRHRLNKNKHKQRMPVKPPPEPEEGEDESEPKYGRRPSSALVCCARYRERYLTKPEPEPEPEPPLVIPKDVLSPRQVRIYLAKIRRMLAKPPIAKSQLDVPQDVTQPVPCDTHLSPNTRK